MEVTATRKRPRNLSELLGQKFVVATLANAISKNMAAHAYLFSGPRGTGKTSAARVFAKSLNCQNGPTLNPCGACGPCVEITKGTSPDVIEIDGASNTSVNDVREIKDEVLYAPQSSHKKIYIIDEVHMLSNSAFNALLKTIEEPPAYIIFIFATTELHKVPPTVRSRCQQFRFRLFTPELIRDKLVEAAAEVNREFENDALYWIARESAGSMRDAYTLFDQVLSFSGEKISLANICEKMGLVGIEHMTDLLEAAAAGDRARAIGLLDNVLGAGAAVEQVLLELASYLRDLILLAYGIGRESLLGVNAERFPSKLRGSWNIRRLEEATEEAFSLYRDLRYSLSPRFELELFVGRLCSLSERMSADEVLTRIESLRKELNGGEEAVRGTGEGTAYLGHGVRREEGLEDAHEAGNPPAVPGSEAGLNERISTEAIGGRNDGELIKRRKMILNRVRGESPSLGMALDKALDWRWKGDLLHLDFRTSYEAEFVRREGKKLMQAALSAGVNVSDIYITVEKKEDETEKVDETPRLELVRKVFQGTIVEDVDSAVDEGDRDRRIL